MRMTWKLHPKIKERELNEDMLSGPLHGYLSVTTPENGSAVMVVVAKEC